jgi:UDP-3-O-[3-hydroxymyristoyl] N-acetylglucosamine deacetylase
MSKNLRSGRTRKQRTLCKPVSFSGLGVHTGERVTMRFCPSEANAGISFKRTDLPNQPTIPANLNYVFDTQRSTNIGVGNARVHTVEHVLAAIRAYDIDNLLIEVSNMEPPIGDGSSNAFVQMIEDAGIREQSSDITIRTLARPLHWSDGSIHLVALPYEGYRISYTLNYPESPILRAQYYSNEVTSDTFRTQIAPCRTFSLYEEVSMLMDRGLIKGGSLNNAVVIKGDVIFSKEGLRFPEEMARHKVLDAIGDLSLVGIPFDAHIIAIRSGHASNFQLSKLIYNHIATERSDV